MCTSSLGPGFGQVLMGNNFDGSPKTSAASPTAITPPSPTPVPSPTAVNPIANAQDRAKNLASYQYGLASTIKTGAQGITGNGAELSAPSITGARKTGNSGAGV